MSEETGEGVAEVRQSDNLTRDKETINPQFDGSLLRKPSHGKTAILPLMVFSVQVLPFSFVNT